MCFVYVELRKAFSWDQVLPGSGWLKWSLQYWGNKSRWNLGLLCYELQLWWGRSTIPTIKALSENFNAPRMKYLSIQSQMLVYHHGWMYDSRYKEVPYFWQSWLNRTLGLIGPLPGSFMLWRKRNMAAVRGSGLGSITVSGLWNGKRPK